VRREPRAEARDGSSPAPGSQRAFCRFPDRSHLSLERPDCVGGHVGLELRNVGKNYPFERSRRFPGILANSSTETIRF
jgi:hypothetical protein